MYQTDLLFAPSSDKRYHTHHINHFLEPYALLTQEEEGLGMSVLIMKKGVEVTCHKCGHQFLYKGCLERACCNGCMSKVRVPR